MKTRVKAFNAQRGGKVENNTTPPAPSTGSRLTCHSHIQSTTQLFLSRSSRLYLYQPKSYPNTINPLFYYNPSLYTSSHTTYGLRDNIVFYVT